MSQESAPSNEQALIESLEKALGDEKTIGIYSEEAVMETLANAGIDTTGLEIRVDTHTGPDSLDPTGADLNEYFVSISHNGKQIFSRTYDMFE